MKAFRKSIMFNEAYSDAKLVWGLMSSYERAKNYHFKNLHLNELAILKKATKHTSNREANMPNTRVDADDS